MPSFWPASTVVDPLARQAQATASGDDQAPQNELSFVNPKFGFKNLNNFFIDAQPSRSQCRTNYQRY